MRWETPGTAVTAAFALAAATACGSNTFTSAGGSGGSAAAAGSGGSAAGSGGAGGTATAGAGGKAATGGAGGSHAGGAGGAPTCGTCDGCCVGATCITALLESWSQCGKQGAACSSCAYGVTCDSGTCTDALDPKAVFHIVVDTVDVQPTDANGASWDFDGEPDPEVCFDDGQGTHGCTNYCSNVESCTYAPADGTVSSSGNAVDFTGLSLSHVTMVVYDYDPTTSNDKIGSNNNLQLQSYSTEYSYGPFDRVKSVTFHLEPGP